MRTSQTLLCALLFTAAATLAPAQDRMLGGGIADQCMQSANSQAALWKSQGVNTSLVEKQFQALLAVCSGDNSLNAAFIGAANFDYTRFARMVAKNQISPKPVHGALPRSQSQTPPRARQSHLDHRIRPRRCRWRSRPPIAWTAVPARPTSRPPMTRAAPSAAICPPLPRKRPAHGARCHAHAHQQSLRQRAPARWLRAPQIRL